MQITRIAPTPSGFLHIGNALNFILTHTLARYLGAKIYLRIDDIDIKRTKERYIDDIFETLDWLGLDWDLGAKNKNDFLKNYSFRHRQEELAQKLLALREQKQALFYACQCSRSEIDGVYHGKCKELNLSFETNRAVRLSLPKDCALNLGGKNIDIYNTLGDIVLWRKDGLCSYQFASLLSDEEMGTSLVVRGGDLLSSTAIQIFMAKAFGFENFPNATFIHHPLILDKNGEKLSKSQGADALFEWRKNRKSPKELFGKTAEMVGVRNYIEIDTADKLLACESELDTFLKMSAIKLES